MKHQYIFRTISFLVGALLLCPLCGQSQTMRGDINMDGTVGMDDLSAIINVLLTDSYGEPRPEDRDTITVNGVDFVMVRVHGGTYSRDALDNYIHEVETFSIGQTEVTSGLWSAVMDSTASGSALARKYPIVHVTWNQCQEFISRLNALTGLNFRLPSLIEWEYAASGGNLTRAYRYAGSNNLDEVGWYDDNHPNSGVICPVGLKKPNELGLYDMSGNASEWCQDEIYGTRHGARGGDALSAEELCRTMTWPDWLFGTEGTADEALTLSGLRLAL